MCGMPTQEPEDARRSTLDASRLRAAPALAELVPI